MESGLEGIKSSFLTTIDRPMWRLRHVIHWCKRLLTTGQLVSTSQLLKLRIIDPRPPFSINLKLKTTKCKKVCSDKGHNTSSKLPFCSPRECSLNVRVLKLVRNRATNRPFARQKRWLPHAMARSPWSDHQPHLRNMTHPAYHNQPKVNLHFQERNKC